MKNKLVLLFFSILIIAYPCCKRIAHEKFIARIDFSSMIEESFRVSPDSTCVAYAAQAGNKMFVVVNGKRVRNMMK